ncbi:THO complex subunit 2 [Entophlyctis luteolus]|nr:THO complex subunit 2 [Entophlyctis luteolus]
MDLVKAALSEGVAGVVGAARGARQHLLAATASAGLSFAQEILLAVARCAIEDPTYLPAACADLTFDLHKSVVQGGSSVDVASVTVDVIWLLDAELFVEDDERTQFPSLVSSVAAGRSRLVEFSKRLLSHGFISHVMLKERLDSELLEALQLIQNAKMFNRKTIKINTALVYKQQKFNLLREESEGFSMLETHLATNMSMAYDTFWASHHISLSGECISHDEVAELHKQHISQKASYVIENVTSLIGYFDLNPNKVLDVILDVFIANVVDHWEFFVELLNRSHWQPSKPSEDDASPRSNSVLGQILGFKFDYYNSPTTSSSATPTQLLWIAAILIKQKLVALEDLFPHLGPADDAEIEAEMQAFLQKLESAKKTSGRYKDNTLADAGVLGGEDTYHAKERDRSSTPLTTAQNSSVQPTSVTSEHAQLAVLPQKRRTNQKAVLAAYLLAIGAVLPARQILDCAPQIVKTHSEIADYMCRLLSVTIEPVYRTVRPVPSIRRLDSSFEIPANQPPPMKTLNCKQADDALLGPRARAGKGGKMFYPKLKFFYDDWKTGIPVAKDYDELVKILKVLLTYIPVARDVSFVSKIARLGKEHVSKNPGDSRIANTWLSIISRFLFPALSMTDQNPSLANEIWLLVKLYPYDRRYALYGEWKHRTYSSIPQLGVAKAGCISDAKYTMRRLSKETVKRFGRYVGKIAHSNPTIAFHYVLDLLQTYENQISTVVDGSKYMSELSFDVVAFTLVEHLTAGKDRVQPGGLGIRTWLRSLATFGGSLAKRHAFELSGIVRYVFAQLVFGRSGSTHDLVVLQELVAQMCGVKPMTDDVTGDQYAALGGGETLRREAFGNEPVRVVKRVANRLLKVLVEAQFVLPLAVLMGQHVRLSVYGEDGKNEVKVLGWVLDNVRSSFAQYMEFIVSVLDKSTFCSIVPSIETLRNDYGLSPDVAFAILRPKLDFLIKKSGNNTQMEVDGADVKPKYHVALEETVSSVIRTLPESVWQIMSTHFYATYWQLSLYDIDFPKARYLAEVARLKSLVDTLNADKSSNGASKRKKDKDRHSATIALLEKELAIHEDHHASVFTRLKKECVTWFIPDGHNDMFKLELIDLLLQHCVMPRCLSSPADAVFSAKFLHLAHSLGVPNLITISIYDKLLDRNNLQSIIFLCTEMEARNYGRFLAEILTNLQTWLLSPEIYTRECIGANLPGFAIRPTATLTEAPSLAHLMTHAEFCKAMYKWHAKMHRVFTLCLESGDYAQITNCIIVLDKIRERFPMIREHAMQLDESCRLVIDREVERKDLKLMCTAYSGRLQLMVKSGMMTKSVFQNPTAAVADITIANSQQQASQSQNAVEVDRKRAFAGGSNEALNERDARYDRSRGMRSDRVEVVVRDRDGRDRDVRDRDRDRIRLPERPRDRNDREAVVIHPRELRPEIVVSERTKDRPAHTRPDEKDIDRKDRNERTESGGSATSAQTGGQAVSRDSPHRQQSRSDAPQDERLGKREELRPRDDGKQEEMDRRDRTDSREDRLSPKDTSSKRSNTPIQESSPSRSKQSQQLQVQNQHHSLQGPPKMELPMHLASLREKVEKTRQQHPLPPGVESSFGNSGTIAPERLPPPAPPFPGSQQQSSNDSVRPRNIAERIGQKSTPLATSLPENPIVAEPSSNSRKDVKDSRERNVRDKDRGAERELEARKDKTDKDRDKVDRKDRDRDRDRRDRSRREKDEADERKKRDRDQLPAVGNLQGNTDRERESKRTKVDEADMPATAKSERKRDAPDSDRNGNVNNTGSSIVERGSSSLLTIPNPPPLPPQDAAPDIEESDSKKAKVDHATHRSITGPSESAGERPHEDLRDNSREKPFDAGRSNNRDVNYVRNDRQEYGDRQGGPRREGRNMYFRNHPQQHNQYQNQRPDGRGDRDGRSGGSGSGAGGGSSGGSGGGGRGYNGQYRR